MDEVKSISVFGLGKLGATMVGCFAQAGFDVVGVDVNPASVESVDSGRAPVPEPGLEELFHSYRDKISATGDSADAVARTDASFIIVPTPSLPDGEFDTSISVKASMDIGAALAGKDDYHIVVLTSTVLPGATERDIKTALEKASGKKCGEDFGLCYSPEFIAIGNVIKGLVDPDFFLIGEYDDRSGSLLEKIYRREGGENACVKRMSISSAELTKISVNAFVTMKISFANTLAHICSGIQAADAQTVADAVGTDSRVGKKYLRPAGAFGGPCFPRDNRAFGWVARQAGVEAPLARATDELNQRHVDFLAGQIVRQTPEGGIVGLLGLSYKPDTNLMEESQSVAIAKKLLLRGYRVIGWDPLIAEYGVTEDVPGLALAGSLGECLEKADCLAICTPHPEFSVALADALEVLDRKIEILDIWGSLQGTTAAERGSYHVPGKMEDCSVWSNL